MLNIHLFTGISMLNSVKAFHQTERRIRAGAIVLGIIVTLITMRWFYYSQNGIFQYAFTDRIMETGVIEDLATITNVQRGIYFSLLEIGALFALCAYFYAMKWCFAVLRGYYIDRISTRSIQQMGVWIMITMLYHISLPQVIRPLLSWHNLSGMKSGMFYYTSTELYLMAMGFAFVVVGWVFTKALDLKSENESFV